MLGCAAHWKALDLSFDCIYSGFLGSPKQAEMVEKIVEDFRESDTLVVVDPVMGDAGAFYNSVSDQIVCKMRKLIKTADVITPNFTEACMLLDIPYEANVDEKKTKDMLQALAEQNNGIVVITSMPHESNESMICTTAYDKQSNHFWRTFILKQPRSYPGTGDIFASVMIGSIMQGDSLPIAMDRATQFISQCIKASQSYDYPEKYGVLLEKELHLLHDSHLICEYEEF
jgi:pyridoxine kinase